MPAKHYSNGKPPLSLIPREALNAVAEVFAFGATKYDAHNWRQGAKWSEFANSALRHLVAWVDGEDKDPESGISHLGHVLCNVAFLVTYQAQRLGEDDRYRRDTLPAPPPGPDPLGREHFEAKCRKGVHVFSANHSTCSCGTQRLDCVQRLGRGDNYCPVCEHDHCMCPVTPSDCAESEPDPNSDRLFCVEQHIRPFHQDER